jgi:hypothetical protein
VTASEVEFSFLLSEKIDLPAKKGCFSSLSYFRGDPLTLSDEA